MGVKQGRKFSPWFINDKLSINLIASVLIVNGLSKADHSLLEYGRLGNNASFQLHQGTS